MIRDEAISSGRAVFSVQQLANLIGKKRSVAMVYSARLVKNKMAKRLKKGNITFIDDDFVVSTQLIEPSYVSLNSSLLYHGIIKQVTKNIECVTTRNSINYKELGIRYHKIPSSLFFGYTRERKSSSYVFVAEPEKALIDGLYLNIYSKEDLRELMNGMETVNYARLKSLSDRFKNRGNKKIRQVILSLTKMS